MITPIAITLPTTCAPTKAGAEDGAIPAKVAESIRPIVIAGFVKLVDAGLVDRDKRGVWVYYRARPRPWPPSAL